MQAITCLKKGEKGRSEASNSNWIHGLGWLTLHVWWLLKRLGSGISWETKSIVLRRGWDTEGSVFSFFLPSVGIETTLQVRYLVYEVDWVELVAPQSQASRLDPGRPSTQTLSVRWRRRFCKRRSGCLCSHENRQPAESRWTGIIRNLESRGPSLPWTHNQYMIISRQEIS